MNRIITVNDLVELKACEDGLKWFTKQFPHGIEIRPGIIIHEHNYGVDRSNVDGYIDWFYDTIMGNKSCDSSSQEVFYTCKYGLQNGYWKTSYFNEAGKVLRYERSDGYWNTWQYNEAGKVIRVENSTGQWAIYEYNEAGQETRFENSEGHWLTYEYNEAGQRISNDHGNIFVK